MFSIWVQKFLLSIVATASEKRWSYKTSTDITAISISALREQSFFFCFVYDSPKSESASRNKSEKFEFVGIFNVAIWQRTIAVYSSVMLVMCNWSLQMLK